MKRILSMILCAVLLCTMLVFGASAKSKMIAIDAEPTIAVGRIADGKVYEIKICFGKSLPFTGFDATKTIGVDVTYPQEIGSMLLFRDQAIMEMQAVPTAYNAASGTITAKLLNNRGEEGVPLQQIKLVMDFSEIDDPAQQPETLFKSVFCYKVHIPAGLLTANGAVNDARDFSTGRIEGLPEQVENVIILPAWVSAIKNSAVLAKITERMHALGHGTKLEDVLFLMLAITVVPIMIPSMTRYVRVMRDAYISLSDIPCGGLFKAIVVMTK